MKINNTVPAKDQMGNTTTVSYLGPADAPNKILILGNSITRHAPKEELGWSGDWGMAASAPEKDYVHRLSALLEAHSIPARLRIHQIVAWEGDILQKGYREFFAEDLPFGANIVIFRFGENISSKIADAFETQLAEIADYFGKTGAKILFTTGFWPSEKKDPIIRALAAKRKEPCVELGYTQETEMALGQFEHKGVSLHPSDEGMEQIANKLFAALQELLK